MWAEYLSARPKVNASVQDDAGKNTHPRARRVHRAIALIFTSTVAANFVAMIWGPPTPWITYAPLPPLLLLMLTGLYMLTAQYVGLDRRRYEAVKGVEG